MANIFISHSSKDNQQTKDIFNTLQQIGDSLFLDFDGKHGLKGGNKWEKELYVRVKKARIMIVALSPNWLDSTWCYKEYCMARVLRKKIIPVVITADKRIASWDGNDIQHFDATIDPNAIEQLKERIAELTCHDISKIYDIKNIKSPFVGLRSFNKDEAGIFYGRNDEILDAIDKLNGMASSENQKFLNIIGASGVGKSSFLKAGILPLLELLHKDDWYVLPTFRAKQEFLLNLGKTFSFANGSKEILSQENTKTFFDAMEEQIYKECKSQNRKIEELKILFPIDQAEEILSSTNTQEREQFFKILQTLLEEKSNFFVVWTLRSDHLKKYQDEALLEFLHQQDETLLLKPIASKELKNIIQEPAYTADVHIEEAVVEEIKEDIRSTTSLPLLAHLLQTLYSKTKSKEKKQITLNDYKALSSEGRNPIENIINEQAEKIYKNIKDESLVQELFLNHLLKVNSDESVIKQSANLNNAIPLKQQAIAEQFVAKRLFVKDGDGSEVATIEIAHEALISSWERLVNWIEAEKEFLLFRNHLELLYREWRESNENERALLKDLNLEKALSFKSKLVRKEEIGFVELSFEVQKVKVRRKRVILGGLFISLVIVIGVIGYFWKTSEEQKNIATEAQKKTQSLLLDNVIQQGILYRDYIRDYMKSKFTFADAISKSRTKEELENAKILYHSVNDSLKLRNIIKGYRAKFSNDSKLLLTWTKNEKNILKLWNAKSNELLHVFKDNINYAIFNKDTTYILYWSVIKRGTYSEEEKFVVTLWSIKEKKVIHTFKNIKGGYFYKHLDDVQFLEDGKKIVSFDSKKVEIWNIEDNKVIYTFPLKGVKAVGFFDKDKLYAYNQNTIKIWNLKNGKSISTLKEKNILGVTLNVKHNKFLSWGGETNSSVKLWNIEKNSIEESFDHNNSVSFAKISQNNKYILVELDNQFSFEHNELFWWNIENKQISFIGASSDEPRLIDFSKNNKYIFCLLENKEFIKINLKDSKRIILAKDFTSIEGYIDNIVFDTDEKSFLTFSEWNGGANLYKNSRYNINTYLYHRYIHGVMFSNNNQKILSWGGDVYHTKDGRSLKIWNKNGNLLDSYNHIEVLNHILLNKEENQLISISGKNIIKLWNVKYNEISNKKKLVNDARFENNHILIQNSSSKSSKWTVENNKFKFEEVFSLSNRRYDFNATLGLAFSTIERLKGESFSKDRRLKLTWHDKLLKLHDIDKNITLNTYELNYKIDRAIFTEDAKKILAWSSSRMIDDVIGYANMKLWSIQNNIPLRVFDNRGGGLTGAIFNKEGTQIFSWNNDSSKINLYTLYPTEETDKDDYILKTEVESGCILTKSGEIRVLSQEEWEEKKRRYEKTLVENESL